MSDNLADSVWESIRSRKGNILDLPTLDRVVAPRDSITRELLASRLSWIVGPPKVGKTVIAHYVSYVKWLASASDGSYPPEIMTIDGAPECARAVDLIMEAPYTVDLRFAVFENPFGAVGDRPNSLFLRQLRELKDTRPDLQILVTTRPRGFIAHALEIAPVMEYATPLSISEWYEPRTLEQYARTRLSVDLQAGQFAQLSTPALIDDFVRYKVTPGTPAERDGLRRSFGHELDDVTLDKYTTLSLHPELELIAVLIRLQEHASSLPTAAEISTLAGFNVEDHPYLGLVAATFEFDGLRRLRFEHSTVREAADLALGEAAKSDFADIRRLRSSSAIGGWLDRALTLWQAQQEISNGDWGTFGERPDDIRVALASDALALSGGRIALAVGAIGELTYDAWTAQDLGYEIVSAWPNYADSREVSSLLDRLLQNGGADGSYAVLEALLYVRSPDVESLWAKLDQYLLEQAASDSDLPMQFLLALDGLAWRPPPPWHVLGKWATDALDRIRPDKAAWGFIRFMSGYHPDGLNYLATHATSRVRALVIEDQSTDWSPEQAKLASWLVQWHFIHQCRARAQLARQPWLDQQFLCRSFHQETPMGERDSNAARLIRSLRESGPDSAGWGFFLGENLRAVAPEAYADQTRTESRLSLHAADVGSLGVLACVLTYSVDSRLLADTRAHFRDARAVGRLMEALTDGLVVAGTRLLEPRFSYRRNLADIYSTCGLDWSDVKAAIPPEDLLTSEGFFDVEGLISRLQEAAGEVSMVGDDPTAATVLIEIVRRVRHGDLTALTPTEHRATRRGGQVSHYHQLLESSVAFLLASGA